MKRTLLASLALVALFTSGCVVGQRSVTLPVPTRQTAADKGAFRIDEVKDERVFENNPSDPFIPSVDGDVTTISSESKSRMIGRQRNGFGKAMGDIALPAGDSVMQRSRALVEEGLKRRGYTITSDAGAANSASITIDEFWAWFTPGMWSVSFEARVHCTVKVRRGSDGAELVIKGYGKNSGQVASNENWQLAYSRAFEDFLVKLETELSRAGF